MTQAQGLLLAKADDSLDAAKLLHGEGHYGFAASRAYYTMFYVAEAFLLGKGMTFSKHSAVHAAFGEHFVKTGIVPLEFHRHLIHGMEVRHTADYGEARDVTLNDSAEQIAHAQKFLELAIAHLGATPPAPPIHNDEP